MMSPCQELTDQVSHLKAVFEACDRDRKGYITSDDVSAVTQHMPQDEREMLLELLGTVHGTLDYQTFWKRVNKILESGESSEIPKNKQNVLDNSTEFTLSSPFKPPYNSSLASPDAAKEDNADLGKDDQSVDDQKVVEEEGSREELELLEAGSYRDNHKVFSARGIRPTRIFSDCDSSEPSLKSGVYPRFACGALCPTTARDLSASNDSLVLRDFRTFRDSEFSSLGSPTDTAKLVQQEVEHQISIKMKEEMEQQLSSMKSAMNQINETARQSRNDVFSLMDLVSNMNIGKGESISNGKEVEQLKQSNDLQTLKLEEMVMVVKDVKEELSKKTKHTDSHLENKMEDMKNKYDGKIEDLHKVLELNEELTAMKLKVENMKSQMMLLEVRKMSEQEEIEDSKNRIAREREELRKEKEKLSFEKQELKAKSKELSMEREELMAEKQMIQFGIGFLKHEKEKSDYQKDSVENDTIDNIIGLFNTTSNDKSMAKEILKVSQIDNSMVPKLFFSPSSSPVLRPKKNTPGTRSLPLVSVTTPLSSSRPRREKRQTDFYSSPTSTPSPTGRRMRKSDKENILQSNEKSKTPRKLVDDDKNDINITPTTVGVGSTKIFTILSSWQSKGIVAKDLENEVLKFGETEHTLSKNFMNAVCTLIQTQFPHVKCQDQASNPRDLIKLVPLKEGELALHFHEATIEDKLTWQASVSLPSGAIFLLDVYQGAENTFIGSKVESEIVKVHGFWDNDLSGSPMVVKAMDLETVTKVDSGCHLIAAVVNLLHSYTQNFFEVCTSKFKRVKLEKLVGSSIEKLELVKFPVNKLKRKGSKTLSISIEVVRCCLMPLHYDKDSIVRDENDTDIIICDKCGRKYHPSCVVCQDDNYICC